MPWQCVLLLETDRARLELRRFNGGACLVKPYGMPCHDARVPFGEAPIKVDPERGTWDVDAEPPPHDDPHWPSACACGYEFTLDDTWQLSRHRIYTRQDTGAELTLDEAEPGMIWRTWWHEAFWHGPDGHCYTMRLPGNGEWTIDGPSSNGPGWTRTGEAPRFTVRPSILSHGSATRKTYHGFLTDGVLSDDLDGNTYP